MIINMVGGSGGGFGSFAATLNVTTSAGATVTATSSSSGKTYSGTAGSNGVCSLAIKAPGTYAVTATLDGAIATGSVVVADNGYTYNLTVLFWNGELYDAGNEYDSITGGWGFHKSYSGSVSLGESSMIVNGSGTDGNYANAITGRIIDLSSASKITVTATVTESDVNAVFGIGVVETNSQDNYIDNSPKGTFLASNVTMDIAQGLELDVSSVNSGYIILSARHGKMTVTRVNATLA